MLIVFAGLPGVGKTTLARLLAARTGAVYLRIDSIERALANSILQIDPAEDAGYQVGYAVAVDNLRLGRLVVADSVNPIELTRTAWRAVAADAGCRVVDIEVVCSDPAEHRRRVDTRTGDITGLDLPDWQAVQDRGYQSFAGPAIIVDTAGRTPEASLDDLLMRLPADPALTRL